MFLLLPQHYRTVNRDRNRMLEMRGQRSVDGAGRPTVVVGPHIFNDSVPAGPLDPRAKLRSDLAKHRLDRQNHSCPQLQTAATLAVPALGSVGAGLLTGPAAAQSKPNPKIAPR